MNDNTTKYLLTGIFCVVILYYMAVVLSDASEPNTTQDIAFIQGTNYTLANTPIIDVNSIYNSSLTCGVGNYTHDTTQVTLLVDLLCVNGTYTVDYDYDKSETVWGIDFEFVALIMFIAFGLYVTYRFTNTRKD